MSKPARRTPAPELPWHLEQLLDDPDIIASAARAEAREKAAEAAKQAKRETAKAH